MSRTNKNRSSIRQFFDVVATGGRPTSADLAAEGFTHAQQPQVMKQIKAIRSAFADGEMAEGRALAREYATDWEPKLDKDHVDPETEPAEPLDPRALAAGISRWANPPHPAA